MEKIYAYTYFKFDKYGDEEQHYGFLSASDAEEAHGIAIDLLNGVDSFVCAH
ncbi:MAG: hypothetical protein JSS31_10135, partial [Proteobacteria bacterium]|nr:hypothetical protein [Pseudomonadota bacterium]